MSKYPGQADLRLEVAETPTGLVNLIPNPSGALGGWGWVTPVAGSSMQGVTEGGLTKLRYTSPGGVASWFYTESMPIAAGEWAAASWQGVFFAGSSFYRVRFEWLDAAGAVLSSTAQSAYFSLIRFESYGPHQAPVGATAFRLRFDHYGNTSGGNPGAGTTVQINEATVATAATSGELATVRTNLIPNPSMEVDATGWDTFIGAGSVARTTAQAWVGAASLQGTTSGTGRLEVLPHSSWRPPVVEGLSYTFSGYIRAAVAGSWSLGLYFRDSSGSPIGSGVLAVGFADSTSEWRRFEVTATAPVGAVSVDTRMIRSQKVGEASTVVAYMDGLMLERVSSAGTYFDGATAASGGWTYAWTGTAHLSASTATLSQLAYIPPISWLNIIGPTYRIGIERAELDVSILNASIRDGVLDPAKSNLLRPGKPVRLTVFDGSAWETLYTGKLTAANSKYDPLSGTTDITLSGIDAAAALAQVGAPAGVGTIEDLPYVLEGAGVPWNVNGSGNQVPTATVVTTNEAAKVIDQIAITRDSVHGYAWVDRLGILQAWDAAEISTTSVGALDESDYTADLDVSFDVDRCVNELTIKLLRVNLANGETVEVTYGPYRDEASVEEWGPYSKEFTVQGLTEDEPTMAAFAADVFAANGTPQIRINSITLPIRSVADVTQSKALLDLYDLLQVTNVNADLDQTARVVKLSHEITPGKWLTSVGFSPEGGVAPPQVTPAVANDPGQALKPIQAGTVAVVLSSAVTGSTAVVFPVAYDSPPLVVVTSDHGLFFGFVSAVTATGFNAHVREYQAVARSATINVSWHAIASNY